MKARSRDDTPFIDLMRKIGIKPPCDLTELERRAIEYAKASVNWAAHRRRYVPKKRAVQR